jgi:hypothetical protein
MTELQVGDQRIQFDRERTSAIYNSISRGGADECDCLFCKNFAAQRDTIYPAAFQTLLDQLGIDQIKEGEAFEYGPVENGLHLYGGWFYLAGQLIVAGERNVSYPDAGGFEFWFTKSCPGNRHFRDEQWFAIEFATRIPWVLHADPETARRQS